MRSRFRLLFSSKGLTLVELLAVMVILGIIAAIAVPLIFGYLENTKEDVCHVNRSELEKNYEAHLTLTGIDSSEVFMGYVRQYGDEICPEDGIVSYVGGMIHCSEHFGEDVDGDGEDSVPFL